MLDASAVIAHLDPHDAHHLAAGKALRHHAARDLVLPASAYAEALVGPARRGRSDDARAKITRLAIRVAPIDAETGGRAAELRARHRALRLPDALVLACAEVFDAVAVVTADRRWKRWSTHVEAI